MKIGLLSAMPEELGDLRSLLRDPHETRLGGRAYLSGHYQSLEVVSVFSRWGKVAAASTATTLLTRFGVDRVLFVGVAGAAREDYNIGDIVIATELVQHDMDASALPGFRRFEVPLTGLSHFPAAPDFSNLVHQAAQAFLAHPDQVALLGQIRTEFNLPHPRLHRGLIASGDRFIADTETLKNLRAALPELACVEMEGAAVAQVCHEHKTPFAVVRILSDRADHQAAVDFPRFVQHAATPLCRGVILQTLTWLGSLHHSLV